MRKLKTFNENNADNIIQKEYLSTEELEEQLDSIFQINNFEASVKLLRSIKNDHPYIKTESPYKEIYMAFLKKWYNKFKVDLDLYKPEGTFENVDYTVEKDYISIDELRSALIAALKPSNFEASTKLLRDMRKNFPYIKTLQPYKNLYDEYLKKWNDKFKEEIKTYVLEK